MSEYGLEWFVAHMERKLRENEGKKTGWDDIDQGYAVWRMREELEEVAAIVADWDYSPEQAKELIRECADVANFAFMLALTVKDWDNAQGDEARGGAGSGGGWGSEPLPA